MTSMRLRLIRELLSRLGLSHHFYQQANAVLRKHADLGMAEYKLRKRLGLLDG